MTEMQAWECFVGLDTSPSFYDEFGREKSMNVNLKVDASKLTEEEFDELVDRLEELGRKNDFFEDQADFSVDYIYKDGEESATNFTMCGWCYESIYDEVMDCLDYYGVNVIGA